MKEAKKILRIIKQDLKPIQKDGKEELLLINQKNMSLKQIDSIKRNL